MKSKIATLVKSVRFPDFHVYSFLGYRFEIPSDLVELQIIGKRYVAVTTQANIDLKACPRCKRLLPTDRFYKDISSCKTCHAILAKKWTKSHPELAKKYAKKYGQKYRYHKKLIAAGLK